MINEEFLYYVWQNRLLQAEGLTLVSGEAVDILHPGYRNFESGPDFFNARIRIAGILWAGNVEIHTRSTDWFRHHHTDDMSYDNIILHVVDIADAEIKRLDGSVIPTLPVHDKYPPSYLHHYFELMQGVSPFVSCAGQVAAVPAHEKTFVLDRSLTERLESRFGDLDEIHRRNDKRWPATFYHLLARSFGFKTNALPFELLAQSIPYPIFMRHKHSVEDLESLLFGQAGLIPNFMEEAYPQRLKKQYRFFKHKYMLRGISAHLWKSGGLRPANFPCIRISQFAVLHAGRYHLLDSIISATELGELADILDIAASDYWYHHFRFGQSSASKVKKLGKEAILTLIINAIVPFLFYFGKKQNLNILTDKALYWIEKCRPENNSIVRSWQDIGWIAESAGQSQGLLHLKKHYCDYKKCVNCGIGQYLLRQSC